METSETSKPDPCLASNFDLSIWYSLAANADGSRPPKPIIERISSFKGSLGEPLPGQTSRYSVRYLRLFKPRQFRQTSLTTCWLTTLGMVPSGPHLPHFSASTKNKDGECRIT